MTPIETILWIAAGLILVFVIIFILVIRFFWFTHFEDKKFCEFDPCEVDAFDYSAYEEDGFR